MVAGIGSVMLRPVTLQSSWLSPHGNKRAAATPAIIPQSKKWNTCCQMHRSEKQKLSPNSYLLPHQKTSRPCRSERSLMATFNCKTGDTNRIVVTSLIICDHLAEPPLPGTKEEFCEKGCDWIWGYISWPPCHRDLPPFWVKTQIVNISDFEATCNLCHMFIFILVFNDP